MLVQHLWGLFTSPAQQWRAIKDARMPISRTLFYVAVLAAIPAICGYVGTTSFGWQVGTAPVIKLSRQSAGLISIAYFAVILVAVFSVGRMIQWMGATYGAAQPLSQCVALAAFIASPLFLVGVFQLIPILWLNLIVGLPALAYTVFLLYVGIPIFMDIPPERGFLFASAVLAVGLVGLVGLLAVTVILWGIGIGPVFVY
ncbi:MAG: Yip1 family protein [Gammaproteobacteria bacterium]